MMRIQAHPGIKLTRSASRPGSQRHRPPPAIPTFQATRGAVRAASRDGSRSAAGLLILAFATTFLLVAAGGPAHAAPGPGASNSVPRDVFLLDSMGRLVVVPTNEMDSSLLPPASIGLKRQTPDPVSGSSTPGAVSQRRQAAREGMREFQFFPAVNPPLMPYLSGLDEHGNTALRPGPLFSVVPLEPEIQGAKYWLGERGVRYSFEQSLSGVRMSDVKQGSQSLGFYSFEFKAQWAVVDAPSVGTAGWISTKIEAKTGLGDAGETQSPESNLDTITKPNNNWSGVNGFRVPELAWQHSLRDGEVVVVAGMVSQRDYLDGNAFAHTARGEFMNSALVHSEVMPLADYSFGLNLQWQPRDEWYAILGASAGDAPAGYVPWTDFSWSQWSLVGEFGYAPADFLGLGPGIYRAQPFVAEAGGPTQAGVCFDFQQDLGRHSPFAWFGRFGFGGSKVTAGASAQVGTGLVMQAPLKAVGLAPKFSNDLLGIGFVWSQPSATTKTIYHQNEYILESFYTLRLTPTVTVQPDVQVIWNPAFNPDAGPAVVAQLQLNLVW